MVEMIQTYLKDEIELEYGKGLTKSERKAGEFPVYGSNGIVDFNDKSYFKGPGIIIGRKGTVGSVKYEEKDFWAIDTTYVVKLKNKNEDLKFWYYLLQTLGLENMNSHSAVPGLNRDRVYDINISIPKYQKDRNRIANILSILDKKIELNNQMNDNLKEIIQKTIKGKFCKKNQKLTCVKKYGKIQGGYAFKSNYLLNKKTNNKVLKIKNINAYGMDLENTQYINDNEANKIDKKFIVHSGNVIIAMTGAELGKTGYIYGSKYNYYLNQRVGLVKGNSKIEELYLNQIFLSKEFQILLNSKGYGSAQPNISTFDIENIEIPELSNMQLENLYNIILPIYRRIIKNSEKNQTLKQIRDILQPKLVNGEIDLENS